MEYDFLFFNLNDLSAKQLPEISRKQQWFRRDDFRSFPILVLRFSSCGRRGAGFLATRRSA
jgi:hypothetical protein